MSLLDLFKPKWKHSDKAVRLKAVQKGNLKVTILIELLKNKAEEPEIRKAALSFLTNETQLAAFIMDPDCWQFQKDIIVKIETLPLLKALLEKAQKRKEKKVIALLKKQIESREISQFKELRDQDLLVIADKNESHNKTKDAIKKVKDPKLLAEWMSNKVEQEGHVDYGYYTGFAEAAKKLGLEYVAPHISSIKLIDQITEKFTQVKDLKQLYQVVVDKDRAKEYLENYFVNSKESCMQLLQSIEKLEEILELTQTAKYDDAKLCAYLVASEEVLENSNYQDALIDLVVSKNQKVSPDVKSLLQKMGKSIIYNIVEVKREVRCEDCKGTGQEPLGENNENCESCNGTGSHIEKEEKLESLCIENAK